MTAPGQVPAPETIEVAPVESFPRARTEIGTWRLHAPEGVRGDAADWRGTQIALSTALSSVFHPARDRILWETMAADRSPSVPWGNTSDGCGSSYPSKPNETNHAPSGFIPVPRGASLSLALGMALARRNLHQEHWIAAVTSVESLLRSLTHDLIEQLQQVESRLLLVVVDDGTPPAPPSSRLRHASSAAGQFDQLDSRWLAELGLPCRVLDLNRGPAPLLTELQQIAQGWSPSLVHLRIPTPPPARSDLPTESSVRGTLRLFGQTTVPKASRPSPCMTVIAEELRTLAENDPRVVAVVQEELWPSFAPGRRQSERNIVLRPGEPAALTHLRGLALGGCRPVVIVSSRSLPQLTDHLSEQLCESSLPVTLIVEPAHELSAPADEHAHRPNSDLAYLRLLPHTTVCAPRDAREARRLLGWSLCQTGPVAIRLPCRANWASPDHEESGNETAIELGRAELLAEGLDVALLAVGSQVSLAQRASVLLSEQGVSVGVVDARFVSPLDGDLLRRLAERVSGFLTLEEETPHGGFGAAILEQLAADGLTLPVIITGSGPLADAGVSSIDPDEHVRHIVRQAADLVDHAAGINGFYGLTPRRPHANGQTPVAPPDFSSAALEREKSLVATRKLSAEVEEWFAVYSQVGERKRFLWQWCEQGAELTTLPAVPRQYFQHVCQTKVLSIMLCVLLDDVADQKGRERFLEVILKIVDDQPTPDLSGLTADEQYYAQITRQLSDIYHARVRQYPCHAAYADLLRYDQLQYFNTMRYSQLLNQNLWLLNPVEHDLYLPHAMDMMSFATIDLMCTPDFSCRELGHLREALWFLQCMGRVGNLLCTWRREIGQQDFTSGVFARAIAQGDLTVEQLSAPDPQAIETAILKGGHERYFLQRWRYYRECFLSAAKAIESVDMLQLLEGNERFFRMHLASRGLI